jgi:hypothetical protein
MKPLYTLSFLLLISVSLFGQATVNFETNGNNWNWILFQPDKAVFDVVANPSVGGLNTTDSCAMLQITDITADPWSGVFCIDFPDFVIDATNCYVHIFVYKDHISNVGLKLEPARTSDYNIPNTLINQWEEIIFDYSAYIGGNANTLTIIPDFSSGPPRPYTSTNYFDQVSFSDVVPVELTSFTGSYIGNTAVLNWVTATELNNRGFEIQRSNDGQSFITIAFVNGYGTTTETHSYTYVDKNINPNTNYYYRLRQVDYDGKYFTSEAMNLGESGLSVFALDQNYPNPFNPSTQIKFSLPHKSNVTLNVYNLVGQKVATLMQGTLEAGTHTANFNAENLSSGVYIYTLEAQSENGSISTLGKKMTLLK